jgi:hypothetical protein
VCVTLRRNEENIEVRAAEHNACRAIDRHGNASLQSAVGRVAPDLTTTERSDPQTVVLVDRRTIGNNSLFELCERAAVRRASRDWVVVEGLDDSPPAVVAVQQRTVLAERRAVRYADTLRHRNRGEAGIKPDEAA